MNMLAENFDIFKNFMNQKIEYLDCTIYEIAKIGECKHFMNKFKILKQKKD